MYKLDMLSERVGCDCESLSIVKIYCFLYSLILHIIYDSKSNLSERRIET